MENCLVMPLARPSKIKKSPFVTPVSFDYRFGIYWDSWGHHSRMNTEAVKIAKLKDLKTHPIGGEAA